MKKIAFVSINNTAPWGGSEELWSQTAIRLAQQDYSVSVNVRGWTPRTRQMQAVEAVCATTYRWYNRNVVEWLAFMAQRGKNFYRWLDRVRPDLVVISQSGNHDGLAWMEACRSRQLPYITISHVAAEHYWLPDAPAARLADCFAESQQNYFVSRRNLDLTVKQIGAEIPNAAIVRNPYSVAPNRTVPWANTETGFKLACVGRLHPTSKGQDLILEVLRQDKWKHRPLSITFFGTGEHENTLKQLAALWQIEQVTFGGFLDDVEKIWATHHGLILPSRYEGLPLVVVEAMLCGRTCIVTDVAGNTELVEDNLNGFVAKAPTAELLDEALERAWQQRESWYEIGKVAADKAREVIPSDPIAVFAQEIKTFLNAGESNFYA